MPVLMDFQLVPLSVDRKAPPLVPAKRFVPETANAETPRDPAPGEELQLVPLFVDRKTPPLVPAKRFVPEKASAQTKSCVKPVFMGLHEVPLLVDRKTPPPSVPAKRFVPEMAKQPVFPPAYGKFAGVHWALACATTDATIMDKKRTRLSFIITPSSFLHEREMWIRDI